MSENKTTKSGSSLKENPLLKKQVTSQKKSLKPSLKNKTTKKAKPVTEKTKSTTVSKQKSKTKKIKGNTPNVKEITETMRRDTLKFLYRKTHKEIFNKDNILTLSQLKDKTTEFVVNALNNEEEEKEKKPRKDAKYYDAAVQDYIPLKEVRGGMICTTDNRYISMVEVLPINFYNKTKLQKKSTQETFGGLFHNLSARIQLKAMNDVANPARLIDYVTNQTGDTKDEKIKETLNDYIQTVKQLSKGDGVTTRFFIFYEYTGDQNGRKSNDIEEIYQTMMDNRHYIYSIMQACGQACYIPDDYNMELGEYLYYFFNRRTSREYTLRTRINRLRYDEQQYNNLAPEGKKKKILDVDLIAPKGLYFVNREFNYMDGLYYSYLAIKEDDHPMLVGDEWLSNFINYGERVDLDIILNRLPHDFTMNAIKHYNEYTGQRIYGASKGNRKEKANKLQTRKANNTYVYNSMQEGEHLYECLIFITIKAETIGKVKALQRKIIKDWSNYMSFEDSYLSAEDFFNLSMPFIQIRNPIFRRNKHNYLDQNLKTLYMFTSYTLFNHKGYVLGKDKKSIIAINNFDTSVYSNANMVLLGTSGAGKTFTEQLIAQRMLMTGIKDYFIIPKKGYEYLRGCKNVNGAYITLAPGSKDCVNILEIRPEKSLDVSVLSDSTSTYQKNIIAQKVTSIILWIQLLLGKETMSILQYNELSTHITLMYESFGITSDPASIYEDKEKQILKKMPIITDLYNEICKSPTLKDTIAVVLKPFVHGICENMNGQTNVDLYNNYIVFDVDEDIIGADLLPSFLYIAFDFVYSSVKEREGLAAIFLDEVWKMMSTEACAEQVQNIVKLVRGYGGCAVIATQEINDFMSAKGGFGKSVINNTDLKLILKTKEEDLKQISQVLELTETDKEKIKNFKTGNGMLIANGDKVSIEIVSSFRELRAFNTDKTKEIQWAQEDRLKAEREKKKNVALNAT